MHRVSSAADFPALETIKPRTLLWLDLDSTADVDAFNTRAREILDEVKGVKFMVTCDDGFNADKDRSDIAEELLETLNICEVDIGEEKGVSNVYADQLHEEFKLLSSFGNDKEARSTQQSTASRLPTRTSRSRW